MITEDKITEIFCAVDEFCKEFDKEMDKKSLMSSEGTVCQQLHHEHGRHIGYILFL